MTAEETPLEEEVGTEEVEASEEASEATEVRSGPVG